MPTIHHPTGFERQAGSALKRLRAALAGVIDAIPGEEIRRAADLQRALGVTKTLAWQVHKVATSSDPLAEATKMPGQFAMERFLEAAQRTGVPKSRIKTAHDAMKAFREVVQEHAGDRELFDSMLSALTHPEQSNIDEQYRRNALLANSHIFGLHANSQLNCHLFHRSKNNANMLDFVAIRGLVGLTWIRRNAACVISSLKITDNQGVVRKPVAPQPLADDHGEHNGIGLLREFCSQPLPQIRVSTAASGLVSTELIGNAVGKQSAVTCLVGHRIVNAGAVHKAEGETMHKSIAAVRTPARVLMLDVLMAEDLFGPIDPVAQVYSNHRGGVDEAPANRPNDLLPLQETVSYLGKGPSVLHTPDVPRYAELLEYACEHAGWDAEVFDVYRCRVEYPVMPSSVVVQFELPDKPVES